MLLAIDAGNTHTVFAVIEGGDLRRQWRAATSAPRTADEYAVWLTQLMELERIRFADVGEAIISTVVPQALFDLRKLCRDYFGCEPWWWERESNWESMFSSSVRQKWAPTAW